MATGGKGMGTERDGDGNWRKGWELGEMGMGTGRDRGWELREKGMGTGRDGDGN